MNRRLLMGVVGLLALARCAPAPPPPPVLNLTITGTAEQNPDPTGRASPVAVRVYQLSGTAKFSQADVFGLMNNEAKNLGAEEATSSMEFLIAPGESKKGDCRPQADGLGDRGCRAVPETLTTRNGARRDRQRARSDRSLGHARPAGTDAQMRVKLTPKRMNPTTERGCRSTSSCIRNGRHTVNGTVIGPARPDHRAESVRS